MMCAAADLLESVLVQGSRVDAQVLNGIWPVEFENVRILVVQVRCN